MSLPIVFPFNALQGPAQIFGYKGKERRRFHIKNSAIDLSVFCMGQDKAPAYTCHTDIGFYTSPCIWF